MKHKTLFLLLLATVLSVSATADLPLLVTHTDFQAVNEYGQSIFSGPTVVALEGILLNNPEEWLDPTADFNAGYTADMGGQWEIFIQGEHGDDAGTACWMGQNYGIRVFLGLKHPDDSYTDAEWLDQLRRLNYDNQTGWVFRAGDRVRVIGYHFDFNGKRNINENHFTHESFDFHLELLKPAVGLPAPIEVTLADLKDEFDNFIFGHAPRAGGELYQSRRVRLEGVYLVGGNWAPGSTITVADDPMSPTRTFPVRLGFGEGIARYPAPATTDKLDIIGIMNQNSPAMIDGYYLMALNYDGSGRVLGDATNLRGTLSGDLNNDFRVDLQDFAELAGQWLAEMPGLYIPALPMSNE